MRKKIILFVLVDLLIILALVIYMRPDDFRVSRSASISAPPAAVFSVVNDFHQWSAWDPWGKLDPNMISSFEGSPAGVGAVYTWSGDSNVGEGKNTIVASQPNERIGMKLDFVRPFAGTSDVEFTFKPEGEGTLITWNMSGRNNFIAKAIGLFIDCDKMVGGQFEQGLTALKNHIEANG